MAKKLGQTEETIKNNYTLAEIAERNLFDRYADYIERELLKYNK
jgi:hypothetical protein